MVKCLVNLKMKSWINLKAGEIKALISTTVIEVGVNVPNATVMIIENCRKVWTCTTSST